MKLNKVMLLMVGILTVIALGVVGQSHSANLGLLVKNSSSLDAEEQAAYDFASSHGFTVTKLDPPMIQNDPSVLNNYDGFWADNGSTPTGFNNQAVIQPLLNAINSGKGILFRQYGGFIGQYLGLGTATTGYWCPYYADAEYFVQAIDDHPVYAGIPTWQNPALPNKPEQLIYRVNPGCKTGAGINLINAQVFNIVKVVEAGSPNGHVVQQGGYVFEKSVGQGIALFLPINGFTLGTLGPVGEKMYTNALNYICSGGQPQSQLCDEFDGASINTSMWNPVSGSWTQTNGQLTGYWSISAAQTDQGNILLVDALQPTGDYTVEVDEVVSPFGQYKNGHQTFVLYHSPGNKYNISFGCENTAFGMEYRQGGSNYHTLVVIYSIPYFNTTPGQVNHTKLVRTGNHFQCYLNDHLIHEFDETIFGGDVKIGTGCYGTATYDNFCLTTGGQPPAVGPDIAVQEDTHNFGPVWIGETATWWLVIRNEGDENLDIDSIRVHSEHFTNQSWSTTLVPQQTLEVRVQFTPLENLNFSELLVIYSNDPDQPELAVTLNGTGMLPADCIWGYVYDGYSQSMPISKANLGISVFGTKDLHAILPTSPSNALTCQTINSGFYCVDLSPCRPSVQGGYPTTEEFLYLVVEAPPAQGNLAYHNTRIIDLYNPNISQFHKNIYLARTDGDLDKPYVTPSGWFTIDYDISGDNQCVEPSMFSVVEGTTRKVPVCVYELGKYLDYAFARYQEFPLIAQSGSANFHTEVRVERIYKYVITGEEIDGQYSPSEGRIKINCTTAYRNQDGSLGNPPETIRNFYYWLRQDAAHELFHRVAHNVFGIDNANEKTLWVTEGMTQWARNIVFPFPGCGGHSDDYITQANTHLFNQNPNLASLYVGHEYFVSPVFWTFFGEQLADPHDFTDYYQRITQAYGALAVLSVLSQGANMDAVSKVVKSIQPDGNGYRFVRQWLIANIAKDYSIDPQLVNSSRYHYSQYLMGPEGLSSCHHYNKIDISYDWRLVISKEVPQQETASKAQHLEQGAAAYFMIVPTKDINSIAIKPIIRRWEYLADVALLLVNNNKIFDICLKPQCDLPEKTDSVIVVLFNKDEYDVLDEVGIRVTGGSGERSAALVAGVKCPVHLAMTLPSGVLVTRDSNTVQNAYYWRADTLLQEDEGDFILVYAPEEGIYRIAVLPDSGALPTDSFSLYIVYNQDTSWIARDVKIADIPTKGYSFNTLLYASLSGFVKQDSTKGLLGVNLDIYDTNGNICKSLVTDDTGYYYVDSIPNGDYSISVVTPLGYQADQETKEFTIHHIPVQVDFSLTKLAITPRSRSRAYWADQLCRDLQNKPKDYTRANFSRFAGLINVHFNQNQVNPVNFYTVPQPANQTDSLMVMKKILTMCNNENEPLLKRFAKAQLMALMLNVVSGKISQTEEISEDGRTVSQAITYCDMLVNDEIDCPDNIPGHGSPLCPYILADFILTFANLGLTVPNNMIPADVIQIAYSIYNHENLPTGFALHQNYPNPFNPICEIEYDLPTECHVTLSVYNILGQEVKVLVDENQTAGNKSVHWDGKDEQGQEVTSGVYFYRIQAGDFVQSKKMVLMK